MRMVTALAIAVATVLPGCTFSTADPVRDEHPVCPGLTIEAEPVRGDVNTTFLRAVLRDNGAPKEAVNVEFTVPEDDGRSYSVFGAEPSGPDGVAEVDLGATLLTDTYLAGVAMRAKTLVVEHKSTLPSRELCAVRQTVAFEPSVREAKRPSGLVRTRAELVALLRKIDKALAPEEPRAARLPDGSSACRALYGLIEDSELKGLYPDANRHLRSAAQSCVHSPRLASLDISRVLR